MDKKLATDLLKVFDTPFCVETLQKFCEVEIQRLYKSLRTAIDPVEIYRLQGQILFAETLKKIRDVSIQVRNSDAG